MSPLTLEAPALSAPAEPKRAAGALDAVHRADVEALIPAKLALLAAYDATAIEKVVALCSWGRSGSVLLASFLDWHDEVVMLPMDDQQPIYEFFDEHRELPLRDKLLDYPAYAEPFTPFFTGAFPISPAHYYAAVEAVMMAYGERPAEFLATSRTFFQLLHLAYALALGFRPGSPHPVILYSLHHVRHDLAARLTADFPQAGFLHMVRDPISCFNSTFMFHLRFAAAAPDAPARRFPLAGDLSAISALMRKSHANGGMAERTRAVRFEDVHLHTEATLRRVARWLGLPYRESLVASTIHGIPWVFTRGTLTWSGARPEQAKRQAPNLGRADRALVFALFREEFAAWGYEAPALYGRNWVRRLVLAALWLVPRRTARHNARAALDLQILPAVRRKALVRAARLLALLARNHVTLMQRAAAEFRPRREGAHRALVPLSDGCAPLGPPRN